MISPLRTVSVITPGKTTGGMTKQPMANRDMMSNLLMTLPKRRQSTRHRCKRKPWIEKSVAVETAHHLDLKKGDNQLIARLMVTGRPQISV